MISTGGTTTLGLYDFKKQLDDYSSKADVTYVDNLVASVAGGHKGYATLALATAAAPNLSANTIVEVTNDSTSSNNGLYQWNGTVLTKSLYDPLIQAKAYADANPLFKVRDLTTGEDLDSLRDGIYRIPTLAVGNSLLNLPSDLGTFKLGTVFVYRAVSGITTGTAYNRIVLYYDANEVRTWERTGNGGTTGFVYLAWQREVSRYEYGLRATSVDNTLSALNTSKAEINLFPNINLTTDSSSTYNATLATESGYPTLTLNTGGVTLVAYDMNIITNLADVGKLITFTAEGFSNVTSFNAGDITIQALNGAGSVLSTSTNAYIMTANSYQKLTTTLTLPATTAKIRLRMINRNGTGNTVCKFRNATLSSDYVFLKFINPATSVAIPSSIFYVSKTGNDSNTGISSGSAFLTVQKAINSLPTNGGIVEVGSGDYRETVTVSSGGNVWVRSKRNERAKILGSDQLVVTKTVGFTQIYQAPLAAKPVGMGGGRGEPVIFEWGTPSKPITESERHFLHRGHTNRLSYTEMFEAATKADLDTVGGKGKWFWETGIIYFTATDGSNATLKRYEARIRPTLIHSNGSLHLTRLDTCFSTAEGGQFNGIYTKREDCRTFGNYFNGFSDNANFTESYRDEAGGNGNDGFNGTVTSYADTTDATTRIESVYFDPYAHDNGDDGLSVHYRGDMTIYGGLAEYNTKADVVHVTGAACVCYNTESRGTLNGFYAATTPTGDSTRLKTTFKCVGTKATGNTYCYRAADDALLTCEKAQAFNPTGFGYYQTGTGSINAADCTYTGEALKNKSGTVNVTTNALLT